MQKSIHAVINKEKMNGKVFIISKEIEWKAFIKDLIEKQSLWNKEREKIKESVFTKKIVNEKVFTVK